MLNNAIMQGGKSSRIVNCVLALKSYNEWKQTGGNGTWKFGGNLKASTPNKQLIRKNSDPFTNSVSRSNDNSKMVCILQVFLPLTFYSGYRTYSNILFILVLAIFFYAA